MKKVTLKVNYIHHECDPDFFVFILPERVDTRLFTQTAVTELNIPCNDDDYDFIDVIYSRLDKLADRFDGTYSTMIIDYIPVDANF